MQFPSDDPHFWDKTDVVLPDGDFQHHAVHASGKFGARHLPQCALALLMIFLPLGAPAQTGRITLAGAIIATTCTAPAGSMPSSLVFGKTSDAYCGNAISASVRPYELRVRPVQADTSDPLLRYFFQYVTSAPGQHAAPTLMTLQYE